MKLEPHYTAPAQSGTENTKRDKTLEKIATAIEMGMEDSASRSIASMLQSDVSASTQGVMNANDAISMMQIAGGALNALNDQSQALNDLSVRYNNAALNETQKEGLAQEFSRMKEAMAQTVEGATFNGHALLGSSSTFVIGESTVASSIPSLSPHSLSIDDQEGIEAYRNRLEQAYSDVGSTTNALVSSTDALLTHISATEAARSQLADTDIAKAVQDFQQQNIRLDAAQIAMAHRNDLLQQNIASLLG